MIWMSDAHSQCNLIVFLSEKSGHKEIESDLIQDEDNISFLLSIIPIFTGKYQIIAWMREVERYIQQLRYKTKIVASR
jgi:hypothetical protein